MRKMLGSPLPILLLALWAVGCGGSSESFVSTGSEPGPSRRAMIEQEAVRDPELALKLIPSEHLDDLVPPQSSVSPQGEGETLFHSVAALETNYEILFGSLSQDLGVTLETSQVQSNIDFIKAQDETGNFDLLAQPILNNPLGVTGVAFQSVNYPTTVPLPGGEQSFAVSGGLLMPVGIDKTKVKGIIVYFHGTTFSKSQVGSNYSNPETQLCAQVFASQGYIVAIPDYVGQGADWQNVHPYVLYPKASAQAAADMLGAIKPTLIEQYDYSEQDPALKLFSAGYSEGGAYSLWFNSYLSGDSSLLDPFYALIHSVGMEGAYSTSQVTYDYLFDDVSQDDGNPFSIQSLALVNIVKPILSADAFLSYATYSQNSDFSSVFNMNFFNMQATLPVPQSLCNVDGQQVTIPEAFARPSTDISTELVSAGLGKRANKASYPGPLDLVTSSENSISSLVSAAILEPIPLAELKRVLEAADVDLSPSADAGVSIISLDQDSVVVPNNFDLLLSRYPSKLRKAIKIDHSKLLSVSPFSYVLDEPFWQPIDHLQAPVFEFLYALNTFNEFD